jgi:DNA-binding IclR family transcriptional regulator
VNGSQTLARGLSALQQVAAAPSGLTVQQVADGVGVHRTIAYRLLGTLAEFRLIARGEDGRYRPASGLALLGASFDRNVRQLSVPTLRALADDLGTTVSLLIAEGDQQVAIAVIVPTQVAYQLAFHEGSRYPLNRGAAGIALLASMAPRPGERDLLGDDLRRDRAQHLWSGRTGPSRTARAAHLYQPDLAPGGRRAARQGRRDQGGQGIIGNPRLKGHLHAFLGP